MMMSQHGSHQVPGYEVHRFSGGMIYVPDGFVPIPHEAIEDFNLSEADAAELSFVLDDIEEESDEEIAPPVQIALYPPSQLNELQLSIDTVSEQRARMRALHQRLSKSSHLRSLARVPEDIAEHLVGLRDEFPNMRPVIDLLESQLELARLGNGAVAFPPLLLNGPPGIGKTELMHRLTEILGMPDPMMLDFSVVQSSAKLVGTDAHWSNAGEGLCFSLLAYGEIANPIIVVDEIDKAAGEGRYDPTSSLLSLLEKRTASRFVDHSFRIPFPINASHILWVAASNEADEIPSPVLSRFVRFDLGAPTQGQLMGIIKRMFERMRLTEPWGSEFAPLSDEVAHHLVQSGLVPRRIKNVLCVAAGLAALDQRRVILIRDVEKGTMPVQRTRNGIGFVSG